MEKTILFISDKTKYFFPMIAQEEIVVEEIWKRGIQERYNLLIRICRKLKIPTGIFFGKWADNIQEYSRIIIFDGCYDKLLMYFLDKKCPEAEKNVFCWNTKKRLGHVWGTPYPMYSFDPIDAKECNMKFLHTFYSVEVSLPQKEECYDVIFLANVKARGEVIEKIYQKLQKQKVKSFFYLLGAQEEVPSIKVQTKRVDYVQYLEMIAQSKAILDVCPKEQNGLTQRIMEALFLKKKLITTNRAVKEYDFYNENNIYVIEDEECRGIDVFLSKTYEEVPKEVLREYDVSQWIEKFKNCKV